MSTSQSRVSLRGTPMVCILIQVESRLRQRVTPKAIACVTAIAGALGAMYIMGQDTKEKEGRESTFSSSSYLPSSIMMLDQLI
ncbi:hypothetical protein L208DRAFT_1400733 [Tricholoma matsutake]|nr:hypothetical protein L208DRAFT_1400733 [Tricholoma matsutake 945]